MGGRYQTNDKSCQPRVITRGGENKHTQHTKNDIITEYNRDLQGESQMHGKSNFCSLLLWFRW